VCGGPAIEFLDLGRQPLSDSFRPPDTDKDEFFYRLGVGQCTSCTMVQLLAEVHREYMFHFDYPYRSSGSQVMREHFARTAADLVAGLTDPFVVELGCNDGVLLRALRDRGVRHLGFEPSGGVAEIAAASGVRVRAEFFEEHSAADVRRADGQADVVYAANTLCHIPYLESVMRGVDAVLGDDGVLVFEDPYLGDILAKTSFDQIYDEHFFYFTARSVRELARRFGLELVDVRRLPVHGGEVRYTLARAGHRAPTPAVSALLAEEDAARVADPARLNELAANVRRTRDDLVALLTRLRAEGREVAGYGATAKSATVTNFCGIGPELVSYVCDTTPAKQGMLTPGRHLPVHPVERFTESYPDYAVLFAWNHADEIMAKEQGFRDAGGRWILYVPNVHVV
jgi:methylation protein EvaC